MVCTPLSPFSSLYKLMEGRALVQGLLTAKTDGIVLKEHSLKQFVTWKVLPKYSVVWKTHISNHEGVCHQFWYCHRIYCM